MISFCYFYYYCLIPKAKKGLCGLELVMGVDTKWGRRTALEAAMKEDERRGRGTVGTMTEDQGQPATKGVKCGRGGI